MMDLRRHLRQGAWAVIDKGMTGIYGFAFIFLVVAKLPKAEYGLYSIVFALASMALLFNKSFILFPMTKYEAEGESQPKLLGSAFIMSAAAMEIIGILVFLAAPGAGKIFHSAGLERLLRYMPILLTGFLLRDFALSYLLARRQVKTLALLDAVYFVGLALGFAGMNIMGVFDTAEDALQMHIFFAAVSSLCAVVMLWKNIKIDLRLSREEMRRIIGFGKFSLGMGVGEMIFYQVDLLLLGRFFEPLTVAKYNAARILFRFYSVFSQSLNLLMFPGASKLSSEGRKEDIRTLYAKVIAYYWSIMLGLNIILIAGGSIIMGLLNYPESANIFRLLLLFSFFEPLYTISMVVLYGMGKPYKAFKPLLLAAPVYVGLNLLLIPGLGGQGAAWAFGLNNAFLGTMFLRTLKGEIGIRLSDIFRQYRRYPQVLRTVLRGEWRKRAD